MTSILSTLFEHNLWANLRTVDACASLTDAQWDSTVAGTMGSVRDTLQHVAVAEQVYVSLLSGGRIARTLRSDDDWPGIGAMRSALDKSGRALIEMAANSNPSDRSANRGREIPSSTLYTQAINHATEHRSQIFTILSQQGIEPPNVDGWTFGSSREAAD